jgi:hypothetical protein
MKMRTRMIIISILILLLAIPAAVYAQVTAPQEVADAFAQDISNGNTDEAMALMDPEAVVDSDQGNTTGAEGTPEYTETPQQTYSGEAEARAWLEGMVGQNPDIAPGECAVDGQTVTCPVNYADDALRAIGVEFLPGVMVLEVSEEGKITSYSFTPTAEGVAEVEAAAAGEAAAGVAEVEAAAGEAAQPAAETPDAIPAMGQGPTLESTVATTAVLLLVVGLLLAAWVGLWQLRRRG